MSRCAKVRYLNHRQAVAALRAIDAKSRRMGKTYPVAVYPCERCGA